MFVRRSAASKIAVPGARCGSTETLAVNVSFFFLVAGAHLLSSSTTPVIDNSTPSTPGQYDTPNLISNILKSFNPVGQSSQQTAL